MGREITLAGLFGGIGASAIDQKISPEEEMNRFVDIIKRQPKLMNLEGFEVARNTLTLSKINIGTVNRMAVFSAIGEVLSGKAPVKIDWERHFHPEGT
jgi:hypothetical protein